MHGLSLTCFTGGTLEEFMALTLGAGGMAQDAAVFKSELSAGTQHGRYLCSDRNNKAAQ